MEIKADVKKIESLKEYFFVVPDYQREYVWKSEKQVSRFLSDIGNEFDSSKSNQGSYFIGSTIIVKNKVGSYDVVDGQQRLTTIVISLCAIRDCLKHIEEIEGDDEEQKNELVKIISELLYSFSSKDKKKRLRLELQYEESKDYLSNLISERAFKELETNSIKRMREAYETVYAYLEELKANSLVTLLDYCFYFLGNVEMVIIIPDNISSALKIFETINERGVGLNAMDLLKNLIFSQSKEEDFNKIKGIWKNIITNLDECSEGDKPLRFLRYFLMARHHDGIIREDSIYQWITSDEGKKKTGYQKDALAFAKELEKVAKKYAMFVNITTGDSDGSEYPGVEAVGYLGKGNARQHLILLLALNDTFSKGSVNLLADNIESLFFYYACNKVLTKSYEELFANWATQIRGIKSDSELKAFIKKEIGAEINKRRTAYHINFPNLRQDALNPMYRIKFILGKIERYICENTNLPVNEVYHYQDFQLEHILPQTPENIPMNVYGSKEKYNSEVYKIGNLSLLEGPINQSLNFTNDLSTDAWFDKKKAEYQKSKCILTLALLKNQIGKNTAYNKFTNEHLLPFDKWGPNEISERQEMIQKLAEMIWTIKV